MLTISDKFSDVQYVKFSKIDSGLQGHTNTVKKHKNRSVDIMRYLVDIIWKYVRESQLQSNRLSSQIFMLNISDILS